MERLFSFLLFAALFYLMMRFGCGAHMIHGSHGRRNDEGHGAGRERAEAAKDPVCGMAVNAGQGYSANYHGRELRFCSKRCLDTFEAQPERYAA